MRKEIHILCPEYVPLENKGEEAIIQGTIDTVFEETDYIIHYHSTLPPSIPSIILSLP